MKIKRLNEKLYPISINEDYETIEMEISDSDIHRYLDLKYDSEEIINLAQQLNHNIDNSDLDAAYAEIINHFDEVTSDNDHRDLHDLQNYLDNKIYENYQMIAEEEFNKRKEN